jgi:hypothetical protein
MNNRPFNAVRIRAFAAGREGNAPKNFRVTLGP